MLADHARTVLVIERDDVNTQGNPRAGVPQDRQGHVLLPGGLAQIERWLPGFTRGAQDSGGVLVTPDRQAVYLSGQQMLRGRSSLLAGTRPFLESQIRKRVLALPNVSTLSAQATGPEFGDGVVRAVRYVADGDEHVTDVDFVVDAMGRASKMSDWVEQAGFQRPDLHRLRTDINYSTAQFERSENAAELPLGTTLARFADPTTQDGLSLAGTVAVEGDQWTVLLSAYEPDRPPATPEVFRAVCAKLPATFGHATSGPLTGEIQTYRQADSRRCDFTGLEVPRPSISVGDAVASFNPVHGQGISSAALHASCLSDYLVGAPSLNRAATEFFELQAVVTDAAWSLSAGDDAARLDALQDNEVPEDVARRDGP